jgi:hypothetical protein
MSGTAKAPYFDTTVSTDVDVEISPRELHEAGWHHRTECGWIDQPLPLASGGADHKAIASLHRQAHPGQSADPAACREEPCRSLSFELVSGGRMGRAAS